MFISALLNCNESTSRVVLISLIGAKPLVDVVKRLCINDKVQKAQLEQNITICYEEGYLTVLSKALSKLDLSKTPKSILEPLLSNEEASLKARILLMLLVLVSRRITAPIIPKQTIWFNWILSLIRNVLVNHKDTEIGSVMSQLISSLNICSFMPTEHQKEFLYMTTPHPVASHGVSIKKIVAELTKEPEQTQVRARIKKKSTKYTLIFRKELIILLNLFSYLKETIFEN